MRVGRPAGSHESVGAVVLFGTVGSGVAAVALLIEEHLALLSDPPVDVPTIALLWLLGPWLVLPLTFLPVLTLCAGIAVFAPRCGRGPPSLLLIPAASVVAVVFAAAFHGLSSDGLIGAGLAGLVAGLAGWGVLMLRHRRRTHHTRRR